MRCDSKLRELLEECTRYITERNYQERIAREKREEEERIAREKEEAEARKRAKEEAIRQAALRAKRLEEERKLSSYNQASKLVSYALWEYRQPFHHNQFQNCIANLKEATIKFRELDDYKDSAQQIKRCTQAIERIERRINGRCLDCGGMFTGFLKKTCVICGALKDYDGDLEY